MNRRPLKAVILGTEELEAPGIVDALLVSYPARLTRAESEVKRRFSFQEELQITSPYDFGDVGELILVSHQKVVDGAYFYWLESKTVSYNRKTGKKTCTYTLRRLLT